MSIIRHVPHVFDQPTLRPAPLTVPSTPTLQACSTRFNKGTNYLANNAFAMATKPDLAMYYHRAAFSPVPTTFITAINNQSIFQKALQQQKAITS